MTAKLAPCPFCGGVPDLIRNEMVECCHVNQTINELPGMGTVVRTYGATQADAIAAWNRRATLAPSGDLVERANQFAARHAGSPQEHHALAVDYATCVAAEVAAAERPLRDWLERFAIRRSVRLTYGGGEVPNGMHCLICQAQCEHGQQLIHADDCALIVPQTGKENDHG